VQLSGSGLTYGQAYTVIDANSASNYTGVTVDAGTFFSMISVLNDDLIVRLGLPLTDIGNDAGGDAAVMGGVLNGLQGNSPFGSVVTALAGVSTAEQGNALKQAAPAQVGNGMLLLQRAALITDMVDDAIGRRSGLLHNKEHGIILWADAMGGSAQRNADGAAERTDISAWGLAMGADIAIGNDAMLGGAVSWATGRNTGTGVLSENSNKVSAIALTAYGAWSDGVLMVDGQAALGLNNYVQRRRIDVTGQTAEAHYDGRTYEVLANVGYDVLLGSFKLTPGVSLKWLRMATDGYSEDGAGVLNLTVGDTAVDQLRSRMGVRLSRSFETSVGWLRPDFSVAWQHDFSAGVVTTDAMLSGVAFSTSAARPGADGTALGAGLSLFGAGGTAVQVSYDGEFRCAYASHAGVVKFSISF
jgi:outer membrane autotransporter protein